MSTLWTKTSRRLALGALLAAAPLACGCSTDEFIPVTVTGIEEAVFIAAGARHSCAILENGNTGCWGLNDAGQAGTVSQASIDDTEEAPSYVPGWVPLDVTPIALAAGRWHTCALFADKTVQCWGRNTLDELGFKTSSCDDSISSGGGCVAPPTLVPGLDNVDAIAAGGILEPQSSSSSAPQALAFTCAVRDADTVHCWGSNPQGQLGVGASAAVVTEPAPVFDENGFPLRKIVRISAGEMHACAVAADGDVWCWGSNSEGQSKSSKGASRISGVSGAIDVVAGGQHSCAVLGSGEVMCWGWNLNGQSATSSDEIIGAPTKVEGVSDAKSIVAGARHTCVLTKQGNVTCWGTNENGQLGTEAGGLSSPPLSAAIGQTVVGLAAGAAHTCFLLDDGQVLCSGSNANGQLGIGE